MISAALSMTVLVYSAFSFALTSIAVGMMMILFVACGMRFSGLAAGLSQFLSCVSQWPVYSPRYALRCWVVPIVWRRRVLVNAGDIQAERVASAKSSCSRRS